MIFGGRGATFVDGRNLTGSSGRLLREGRIAVGAWPNAFSAPECALARPYPATEPNREQNPERGSQKVSENGGRGSRLLVEIAIRLDTAERARFCCHAVATGRPEPAPSIAITPMVRPEVP